MEVDSFRSFFDGPLEGFPLLTDDLFVGCNDALGGNGRAWD
ncbi:hypothetical protein MAXJ12_23187 [Mesorhizobium alhagi CCNWXJ12-2]|uniref:Uncharacterized protein n=1 Tax=Mesorhizobium alhagi CCNWXJ12-2 TaxID=1107882 RepID=H0HWT6_9HYPH|nr:hypothetical protein MAXJ12_23187 [Mesorhizobium alhagi CCNWXJ12-2]